MTHADALTQGLQTLEKATLVTQIMGEWFCLLHGQTVEKCSKTGCSVAKRLKQIAREAA